MKHIYNNGQMSEAFITTAFLTLSGGFQDAYTYICRDHVFANGQTGNIVLLAANLVEGSWLKAVRYLLPILSFAIGVYVAEHIRYRYNNKPRFHWRQVVVVLEIALLFLVGFLGSEWNMAANVIVSFVCAMQVQAFRKVDGKAYSSTMCTGNLRSGVEHLYAWKHKDNSKSQIQVASYFGVILFFAIGAAAGSVLSLAFGTKAIWSSCLLLIISLLLMLKTEND